MLRHIQISKIIAKGLLSLLVLFVVGCVSVRVNNFSVVSFYFTRKFYTTENHPPPPASPFFFFKRLPCFHFFFFLPLTISTEQSLLPFRTPAKLYRLDGLVTICSYHKCFIFSMHRLELDCCVSAYFLCSSWSTSTPKTGLSETS